MQQVQFPDRSRPSDGVHPTSRLESTAVEHWHVWRRQVSGVLGGCWVVERRSDWMTRLTRRCILYQSKTSSIVTGWSCHRRAILYPHHAIWWWVMRSNRYWISPSMSPGIRQVSITLFLSCDPFLLCFIILSLTLCHMPLSLLILGLILFPWRRFPFVFDNSFVLMTHFISSTILPIVLTLLLAFILYCGSIYGSHVCGVLSQPQF